MNDTIRIRDIGPHSNLEIQVKPGVNVLCGRNEAGKSIAIRCVSALSGGDAKGLPVKDGSAGGMVSGFGTTISVGMRTQRAGELKDAEPLNERIDLATLVDPRIKDPVAANKHRVRALLTLTKAKLTYEDFRDILPENRREEIDADFDSADPVELAASIKREMEKKARRHGEDADEAASQLKACLQSIEGIDLEADCDEEKLRQEHQTAVERKAKIEAEISAARLAGHKYQKAKEKLETLPKLPDLKAIEAEMTRRSEEARRTDSELEEAKHALRRAEEAVEQAKRVADSAYRSEQDQQSVLKAAQEQHEAVAELSELVASEPEPGPTNEELETALEAVKAAEEAVANGVSIRRAREKNETAQGHLRKQEEAYQISQVYRQAAAATDQVLTNAVKSPYFSVAGGELCAKDHKDVVRPYADLSEGARYKIAIKAVSEAVGNGSFYFVALDQNAWDGLNTESRAEVAREAVKHNVAIITGEVSDDDLSVYHYAGELETAEA